MDHLDELEKEEKEKYIRRRRRASSGVVIDEDDPLATNIGLLVQRIDSGHELLQNLVGHLSGQDKKPKNEREAFMGYMNYVFNVVSPDNFKVLKRSIIQIVNDHAMCEAATTTSMGYPGQPLDATIPSPNTLLSSLWSTTPATQQSEEANTFMTKLNTPNKDTAADLGGYVRTSIGATCHEQPLPGPSGI